MITDGDHTGASLCVRCILAPSKSRVDRDLDKTQAGLEEGRQSQDEPAV